MTTTTNPETQPSLDHHARATPTLLLPRQNLNQTYKQQQSTENTENIQQQSNKLQRVMTQIEINNDNINDNINESFAQQSIPSSLALICGGCAGTSVDVCLYPIDTLKTRLQSSQGFWKSGGFRGIYRGMSAAAIGSAPGAALFFVSYETFKPIIHNRVLHNHNEMNSNPLTHMIAAGCGEIAACLIRVPTEVIKQNMQTGRYNKFTYAITDTWKKYKLRGFYTGYGTTVLREIPFSFIQFPIWERLKLNLAKHYYDGDTTKVAPWQGALCGSVAGSIAAATTTPLDVVKTRLMLKYDANGVPYQGFKDCVSKLYMEEGPSAFFKGITPRVSWIFVGGFFFFGAYEKSRAVLSPLWGNNNYDYDKDKDSDYQA